MQKGQERKIMNVGDVINRLFEGDWLEYMKKIPD